MRKKQHILWITPGFAADEQDTQCIPALQLFAKAMSEQEMLKITIISLFYPKQSQKRKWFSLDVYDVYTKSKACVYWRAWKTILAIHKKNPIDIVHSFWLNDAAVIGQCLYYYWRKPHWITLMGQDVRPSNAYLKLFSVKKLNTIALSNFHNQQLKQTVGCSAKHIIPWGVNQPKPEALKTKKTIDILGVGNLIALKDYSLFIRLIKQIKENNPQIKAALIGKGVQATQLKQEIKQANLDENISMLGALDRAEVLQYMQRSKVLLHPSTFESFGMVCIEALAMGAQVVSRPVGIAKASSHWHTAENEEGLLQALQQALSTSPLTAPEVYNIEQTVASYMDLYQSAEI